MVGYMTLNHVILVRIQVPQQSYTKSGDRDVSHKKAGTYARSVLVKHS